MSIKALKSLFKSASGIPEKTSFRSFAKENPLTTFGLAAPTAGFLATDIAAPIGGGLLGASGYTEYSQKQALKEQYDIFAEQRSNQVANQLRNKRIEEMVQRNMDIVAQYNPQLYNQVMAGKVLPKGAVVLGGPRRQDLMEELAYMMGSSSSPEDFQSLLS